MSTSTTSTTTATSSSSTPATTTTTSTAAITTTNFNALSVTELKQKIHQLGLSTTDCFEKKDLVTKLEQGLAAAAAGKCPVGADGGADGEKVRKRKAGDVSSAPQYPSKCGYTTVQGKKDWLAAHGITNSKEVAAISNSMDADRNLDAPLYYWQLFSLLGVERIQHLVTCFYKRVYADTEQPWFRDAFADISGVNHHIQTQTGFWVDVMGGGAYYHGGDFRLKFHHTHNAEAVMNAKGAQRWMHHMRLAVQDNESSSKTSFAKLDPRILPCLKDFLWTKMQKYAREHSWKFDQSDFDKFPQ